MSAAEPNAPFAKRLLDWWHTHGRRGLPWQQDQSPYRVWVAEIMLQQTQVATAIPYFERFMAVFPDLESLAGADIDDVLAQWSGLGYYARARNLHAAARRCMETHDGALPEDADRLRALPGIGPSTANAIIAQAFGRRAPILDGNVKRVLARHAGIEGWPGRSAVLKRLWREADRQTPKGQAGAYTQAIMDLGATVCTPRGASCAHCPVAGDCVALAQDRVRALPAPRPTRQRPVKHTLMFLVRDRRGRVLLERRPPSGVWGGLWCLPDQPLAQQPPATQAEIIRHQFTHFELTIHLHRKTTLPKTIADRPQRAWFSPMQALNLGLPRPVRSILESL